VYDTLAEQPNVHGAWPMNLDDYIGEKVVVDLSSPFVCLGTLKAVDGHGLVLTDADIHDLRDTPTNRENYVVESKITGIKQNRKQVLVKLSEVVAIARLKDILID
jgi:small nuclear ribonucleoprotein (snRNP)-like protein